MQSAAAAEAHTREELAIDGFTNWLIFKFGGKGYLDQDADLITLGLLSPELQDRVHRYQTALRECRQLLEPEAP
jgi:hypothetical protein